jgi:uncharacterized protein (DUF1697 family)
MPVIISMLRGVSVGGRNKIKMDALRSLYLSLKLKNPQTFIQSGNVISYTQDQDRIQDAIHRKFGFRPDVLLRDKPCAQSSTDLLKIKCDPEELHIRGRELYIYFPNRMARPKLA